MRVQDVFHEDDDHAAWAWNSRCDPADAHEPRQKSRMSPLHPFSPFLKSDHGSEITMMDQPYQLLFLTERVASKADHVFMSSRAPNSLNSHAILETIDIRGKRKFVAT